MYNDLDTVLQALRLPKYEQYYPVRKFKVPVDTAKVKANGTLLPTDPVMTELRLEVQEGKPITKSDLIILALIASNDWNRPICFTAPYPDLGFYQNLRKEGTVYRLIPKMVEAPQANWATEQAMRENYLGGTQIRENNTDSMYSRLMNIFAAGSLNKPGIYLDEVNRREALGMRNAFAEMAGNLADKGRKEDGRKLLTKFESMVNPANLPYAAAAHYNAHNQSSLIYMEAAYKTGDTVLAEKVRKALVKDLDEQEKYYTYLKNSKPEFYTGLRTEEAINNSLKEVLNTVLLRYDPAKAAKSTLPEIPAIPQPGGAGQDTIPKDTGKVN